MTTAAEAKDTKRTTVTRAEVVQAACDLLDSEGPDALTMAKVAERVGFTTMAVYRHVENRQDLVDAAVDHVLNDVSWDALDQGSWIEGVLAWMRTVRACLRAHPWAPTLLGSNGNAHPPLTRTVDRLAAQLERSPLDAQQQARALAWVTRVTVGVLVVETAAPIDPGRSRSKPTTTPHRSPSRAAALSDDLLFDDLLEATDRYLTDLAGERAEAS